MEYAVFVLENLLIRAKFQVVEKQVGKIYDVTKGGTLNGYDRSIADLLTRVRNANAVRHEVVEVPSSNVKKEIANILLQEGYIKEINEYNDGVVPMLRLSLKYGANKERVITGIKRISKPGLRVYCKKDEVPKVLNGLGIAVVSTSNGIMVDREARKNGLGGEVICYVW